MNYNQDYIYIYIYNLPAETNFARASVNYNQDQLGKVCPYGPPRYLFQFATFKVSMLYSTRLGLHNGCCILLQFSPQPDNEICCLLLIITRAEGSES